MSPPYKVWWWRYNSFGLPHDVARPRYQRAMWLNGWEPLMASHHPAKFGGHRHYGNGDMFLVPEEEDSRRSHFNPPLLFSLKNLA